MSNSVQKGITGDKKTILVIIGYLNSLWSTRNPSISIHDLIIYTCYQLYFIGDYFKFFDDNVKASMHGLKIEEVDMKIKESKCYGGFQIDSYNNQSKYKWTLFYPMNKQQLGIGISSQSNTTSKISYIYNTSSQWLVYTVDGHHTFEIYPRDNKYVYGMVTRHDENYITMILDMKVGTIEYIINDVSFGIAFENIKKDESIVYRFTLWLYGLDKVTLIDFQIY